jgi:hypothetical protein
VFIDTDVDQARAAGVLIEFEQAGRPIIVDGALYRELVKGAIKRTRDDLEAAAATIAKEKQSAGASKVPADPVTVAKRERDACGARCLCTCANRTRRRCRSSPISRAGPTRSRR